MPETLPALCCASLEALAEAWPGPVLLLPSVSSFRWVTGLVVGVTCNRARVSGDTGLRFPALRNPALTLCVPVGVQLRGACPLRQSSGRVGAGPFAAPRVRGSSTSAGSCSETFSPSLAQRRGPSCSSPDAGHVLPLRVVMETGS